MDAPSQPNPDSLRQITLIVYVMQAASFLVGITLIAAVVLNYVKRDDAAGTIYESHFRWQIRTFWFALLWGALGMILSLVLIGIPILIAAAVWLIYRIVKGWLRLSEGRPMYEPA
jgi:uncharacterized membrane protein